MEYSVLFDECKLGSVYSEWLAGDMKLRFGQYIFNNFGLEFDNSYYDRCPLTAYNKILSLISK